MRYNGAKAIIMVIQGQRILLRAIEAGDLPALHAWSNDPVLAGGLGEVHFPSSLREQEQWLERVRQSERTIRLAVQTREGRLIGYTGFWELHWRDRRAEHALVVGDPEFRGRGFGREIIATCARYAFEEMDLFRLDAAVLQTNAASLKAYAACGFEEEGTLRGHAFRHGQRIHRVMLGLLAADYGLWANRTRFWEQTSE